MGTRGKTPSGSAKNEVVDNSPKGVCVNGDWLITWLQNGSFAYKKGLSGTAQISDHLQGVGSEYQIVVKPGADSMAAIVYASQGEGLARKLSASFYDANKGVWSGEAPLTEAAAYVDNMSPAFSEDGTLNVAYTQRKLITEAVPVDEDGQLAEVQSISNKSDLKTLKYTPVHDLSLDTEAGISLEPAIPVPGATATVRVTVRNEGDYAENAVVYLYEGDPAAGGTLLTSTAPEEPVPARTGVEVALAWLADSGEQDEYNLYAVVRSGDGITERDEDNNTINRLVTTADIAIAGVEYSNLSADSYLVSSFLSNEGGRNLENVTVTLTDANSGRVLESRIYDEIEAGQSLPLSMLVSAAGLTANKDSGFELTLRASLPAGVNDNDPEDNTAAFTLTPATLEVKMSNIGNGDEQVDIDTAVALTFNMPSGQGAGFANINLTDEELNEVEVTAAWEANVLTVTPLTSLANGVRYTLTIPADALGDAYGHALERAYTLSFTTATTSPAVVFSLPGINMENTAADTDIRLKFNQSVAEGPSFTNMALRADNAAAPVTVSIDSEWLYIHPTGILSSGTAYELEVPRGTVINGQDEAQQTNYTLNFTTTGVDDGSDGDNSSNGTGGHKHSTPVNTSDSYSANIAIGGNTQTTLPITVNADQAEINLGGLAAEIFDGGNNGAIHIPSIPGVSSYTLKMPAAALSGTNGKASLAFNTGIGSVIIPSGMLLGVPGLDGKTAGITIAEGDRTQLSDDIKAAIGNRPLIRLSLILDDVQTDWSNPDAPVMVSIPYTPTAEELAHPESIVVWYIDGSGNVVTIPNGRYDAATGTVTFSVTHFSDYTVAYNRVSFNDVAAGAWYNQAVSFIAARAITSGTGDGNYSPEAWLTRGEFIVLMMRAYGIAPDTNPADNFADSGHTYYTGYLAAAKRLGITNGIGGNMYAPGNRITRQEMFTLLHNALRVMKQLPDSNSGKSLADFTDAQQIDPWAKEAMTLLVETGTVSGSGGKLNPTGGATRAEMAQVLYNLLGNQ